MTRVRVTALSGRATSEAAASEESSGQSRAGLPLALRPVVVSCVLTVFFLPIGRTVPASGLDSSWALGLSLAGSHGIPAGSGIVFTYGPLGFLAAPDVVWLTGAVLGLLYASLAAFWLYLLIYRALLQWLPPVPAVAVTAIYVLAMAHYLEASEIATFAVLLWCVELVRPASLTARLPAWVGIVLGGATALQLLVKFTGGTLVAAALVVALARPLRAKNVGVLVGSFVASLLVLWLAAGESLANFPEWLRVSVQFTGGYTWAMALRDGFSGRRSWVLLLPLLILLGFGLWRLVRADGRAAVPSIIVVAFGDMVPGEGRIRAPGAWSHRDLVLRTRGLSPGTSLDQASDDSRAHWCRLGNRGVHRRAGADRNRTADGAPCSLQDSGPCDQRDRPDDPLRARPRIQERVLGSCARRGATRLHHSEHCPRCLARPDCPRGSLGYRSNLGL